MLIKEANFVKSSQNLEACPAEDRAEYAFIGRSNVGKSSLINMLTNHSKLAKTSGSPGKTQLINHFDINGKWYLVDLPGYGYARTSKVMRAGFKKMIYNYLEYRKNLLCTFVLIDSRIEPQTIDQEFMEWMVTHGLPFVMVFTKADKQSETKTNNNIETYKKKMLESWEELPPYYITSSVQKLGGDEILKFIEDTNPIFSRER